MVFLWKDFTYVFKSGIFRTMQVYSDKLISNIFPHYISMNLAYRCVAYFCGNVHYTRIYSEISRSLTPSTWGNVNWRFIWLTGRLECVSSRSSCIVTLDAEDCNVYEQRCEIRRSQKNRDILHCFGFNYLFEHFKQPTPLGRFDNVMKSS